jgi:hypothetical protein
VTDVTAAAVDEELVRQLTERARAEGLQLTGEGGLLGRLTKLVTEAALEGEMDDHLGYDKHDPVGSHGGNSRNGRRAKTGCWRDGLAGHRAIGRGPVQTSAFEAPMQTCPSWCAGFPLVAGHGRDPGCGRKPCGHGDGRPDP